MRVPALALLAATPLLALRPGDGCEAPDEDCISSAPLPPPPADLGGGLPHFRSPYLGHTGSWDGKGGAMGGASKANDLDVEVGMGLKWTFMPVYWQALEPDGPVDLGQGSPPAWQALDDYMRLAQARGLNVLLQAPVMGGNAGSPPAWAGLREAGKSAPGDMEAAAAFAGKLARRYRPGGTLAQQMGWGESWGVRAWEMDNEPSSYQTHWDGQAADYAEFVTKVGAAIRREDPQALIVAPALASGENDGPWLGEALDAGSFAGSPSYVGNGVPYALGPETDVVSFHVYEGLDGRTIGCVLAAARAQYETWTDAPGFTYPAPTLYWHTEGNFDFLHRTPSERTTAWFHQMFSRAFAAGVAKVNVMDATPEEQVAVATYVRHLPDPFPMVEASASLVVRAGDITAYQHPRPEGGAVWVVWATNGTTAATVDVPITGPEAVIAHLDGTEETVRPVGGHVTLELSGDAEISPPVLVVDGG